MAFRPASSSTKPFPSRKIAWLAPLLLLPAPADAQAIVLPPVPASVPSIMQLLPAGTPTNVVHVASAIDNILPLSGASTAFAPLTNLAAPDLKQTLSQLSGELGATAAQSGFVLNTPFLEAMTGHGAGVMSGVESSFDVGANVAPVQLAYDGPADKTPMESKPLNTVSVWGSTFGGWSQNGGDPALGTHSTNSSDAGATLGVEYLVDTDTSVGAALSYGHTWWNVKSDIGNGNTDAVQFGLYGAKQFDKFYVSAGAGYSMYYATTNRTLALSGANRYRGSFTAHGESVRLEAGRHFQAGDVFLTPYAVFRADVVQTPSYAETTVAGSSQYALSYAANTQSEIAHELGLQIEKLVTLNGVDRIGLTGRVGWLHDYSGAQNQQASMSAYSGSNFSVYGLAEPANAASVSLAAKEAVSDRVVVGVLAQSVLSDRFQSYVANLSLAYRW